MDNGYRYIQKNCESTISNLNFSSDQDKYQMGWEFRVFLPNESATALVDPSKQKECRSDTY